GLGDPLRTPEVTGDGGLIQEDFLPFRIPPVDLGHDAPPRQSNVPSLIGRPEPIRLAPDDRDRLPPAAGHALDSARLDHQLPLAIRPFGLESELGPDLL